MTHQTREGWLNAVAQGVAPLFEALDAPLPDRVRVAIGFTSRGTPPARHPARSYNGCERTAPTTAAQGRTRARTACSGRPRSGNAAVGPAERGVPSPRSILVHQRDAHILRQHLARQER